MFWVALEYSHAGLATTEMVSGHHWLPQPRNEDEHRALESDTTYFFKPLVWQSTHWNENFINTINIRGEHGSMYYQLFQSIFGNLMNGFQYLRVLWHSPLLHQIHLHNATEAVVSDNKISYNFIYKRLHCYSYNSIRRLRMRDTHTFPFPGFWFFPSISSKSVSEEKCVSDSLERHISHIYFT